MLVSVDDAGHVGTRPLSRRRATSVAIRIEDLRVVRGGTEVLRGVS